MMSAAGSQWKSVIRWFRSAEYRHVIAGAVLMATVASVSAAAPVEDGRNLTVIRTASGHAGAEAGTQSDFIVIIDGRRIVAAGSGIAIPVGASVIEIEDGFMTPGLIDANALVEPANLLPESRDGRMNVLHQLFFGEHDPENCAACDGTVSCAFAAAHADLEDDVVCPVCGYPGSIFDHVMDAFNAGVRPGLVLTEVSSEVVPHTHMHDAINLRSSDFHRLAREGVTTVFAAPDASVVIGPQGVILRTAGPIRQRVLEPSDAITMVIGSDPFRGSVRNSPPSRFAGVTVRSRRPNTRMGLTWVIRKALYEAIELAEGRVPIGGADSPSEPALRVLGRMLEGEVPVRVQARMQHDIITSLRLAEEFGFSFTLLEASEAHRCLDELRSAAVPVIYGPIQWSAAGPGMRGLEARGARLGTVQRLVEAGIETALSARDRRDQDGLAGQVMHAVRAGVEPDEAIRMVTSVPARMLRIDDRLGKLSEGMDADLVVWSGPLHEPGTRPVLVMIAGRVVVDQREKS